MQVTLSWKIPLVKQGQTNGVAMPRIPQVGHVTANVMNGSLSESRRLVLVSEFPVEQAPLVLAPLLHPKPREVSTNRLKGNVISMPTSKVIEMNYSSILQRCLGHYLQGFCASPRPLSPSANSGERA